MTHPHLLTIDEKADLADLEELQAWRDGCQRLAEDAMHAGQPVVMVRNYTDDEAHYWLQRTHQGMPLWFCPSDLALTIGDRDGTEPARCVKCGIEGDLGRATYEQRVYCKSSTTFDADRYEGPCLIAGSDDCDCPEVTA